MLKINPFYALLLFYIFINFIFAIIGYRNNYVSIELSQFNLRSESFIIAYFFQLFFCLLIFSFYFLFDKFYKKRKLRLIGNYGAFFLFIFQVCFLLYNNHYGTNIAGFSISASNPILNTFFVLLPADLFYILLSPYLKSNKWFLFNTILYVISNTLRGWMGSILLAFFIYLCRKEKIEINIKSTVFYLIFLCFVVVIVPYLFVLKWAMRSSDSVASVFDMVGKEGYLELLGDGLSFIFNRFQHNYHVALIWENTKKLTIDYEAGRILPYWGEGVVQTIFIKIFNLGEMKTLGQAMVSNIFYSNGSWNSNPGLAGWLIVVQEYFIFYIIYISFVICFSFYIAKRFYDNKIFLVLSVFSIFYLFHGWIGMYITMVVYLLIFHFLRSLKI